MKTLLALTVLLLLLNACSTAPTVTPTAALPEPTSTAAPSATLPPTSTATPAAAAQTCNLQPMRVPTRPAIIPATNQLDETTGLHMTGAVQQLDLASYRLEVSGLVDHPLSLSLDELRCLPKVSASPALVCGDYFTDRAAWSGVPIREILDLAGVQAGAKTVYFDGADGYRASLDLDQALQPGNFLAYEWQNKPVPILHGFPLRAVFPGLGGWAWVKWLVGMVVR
jgi:DMSO/TMAO reductase YedYZ molybdopterin-dependent catalytic subunit